MSLPTCFVVTGFGTKTDYATGRALNLDATFRKLVQPACDVAGINAFRAIDANVTGSIDAIMYRWIYAADYVIADLSTLNANVFYELGVRHAQRPNTTVLIAEEMLLARIPFDVNSFVIHPYHHGGADISQAEQSRFVAALSGVLTKVRETEETRQNAVVDLPAETDSPVFKFLTGMRPPDYSPDSFLEPPAYIAPDDRQMPEVGAHETLAECLASAEAARRKRDFEAAKSYLNEAIALETRDREDVQPDAYIIHQLVLATYKAGEVAQEGDAPNTQKALDALQEAEALLEAHCAPDVSTDPETLGLAGAINKRVFDLTDELIYLERAIGFYERGFYIKQDYYNGINAAFMHTLKASRVTDVIEATVSYGYANMLRRKIVDICTNLLEGEAGKTDEKQWINATLAEAHLGLGNAAEQRRLERKLEAEASDFAKHAYHTQKKKLVAAIAAFDRTAAVERVLSVVRAEDDDAASPPTARALTSSAIPPKSFAKEGIGAGQITITPEIEPGRTIRSVEVTYKIEYE